MAKNEIKTRLTLEGEQNFKRAMKDAQRSLKELNSEQKLAEAQFKATGDAETYQAERARILNAKIEEQKKVVKAAEDALADMVKQGLNKSNGAFVTMQTRVNDAKTKLTTLQTELGWTDKSLTTSADNANELNDKLDNIGKGVTMQNAIDAIDRVTDRIKGIATAAVRTMKEAWDVMNGAGDWADEIMTTAMQYELSPQVLQQWRYASRLIDSDVDAIAGAHQKLTQNMASTSEETITAFNRLGVATKTNTGDMRDSFDVFWEAVDALGAFDNATERDQIAQRVFGRSYRELLPLINEGSAAYKELAASAPVVSEESLRSLASMDDAMEKLDSTVEATKYETLAAMAPTFEQIATSMTTVVGKFNEFVQSEQGQAALERVGGAITDLFNAFAGDVDFETIVDNAAGAINRLGDGLEWLSEHGNVVKDVVIGLGVAFAGLTVTSDVLTFLQLVRGLSVPKLTSLFGGGGGAGAASAATPAVARAAGGVGARALTAASPALGAAGFVAATGAAMLATEESYTRNTFGAANEMAENRSQLALDIAQAAKATDDATTAAGNTLLNLAQLWSEAMSDGGDLYESSQKALGVMSENRDKLTEIIGQEFMSNSGLDDLLDAYASGQAPDMMAGFEEIWAAVMERLNGSIEEAVQKASQVNPDDYKVQRSMQTELQRVLDRWDTSNAYHGSAEAEARFLDTVRMQPGWGDWLTGQYGAGWEQNFSGEGMKAAIEGVVSDVTAEMESAGLDTSTGFTTGINNGAADAATASGTWRRARSTRPTIRSTRIPRAASCTTSARTRRSALRTA